MVTDTCASSRPWRRTTAPGWSTVAVAAHARDAAGDRRLGRRRRLAVVGIQCTAQSTGEGDLVLRDAEDTLTGSGRGAAPASEPGGHGHRRERRAAGHRGDLVSARG